MLVFIIRLFALITGVTTAVCQAVFIERIQQKQKGETLLPVVSDTWHI